MATVPSTVALTLQGPGGAWRGSRAAPALPPPGAVLRRPARGLHAASAVSASAAPASVPERKKALLGAVAASRRGEVSSSAARARVLEAVDALEATSSPAAIATDQAKLLELVSGTWALIYSTKASTSAAQLQKDPDLLQKATGQLYKVFFKFAPFLAGSQDTGGPSSVSNVQVVDLEKGLVDNKVAVKLPGNNTLNIRVYGEVEAAAPDSIDLRVTFTGWELGLGEQGPVLKLPLPRPVGMLRTTFCDDELRLARGGRGGIFITKRIPSS